jgi:transposase
MSATVSGTRPRGRPRKLSANEELHLAELHSSGQASAVELAVLFGVGRSTVYRALQRAARARCATTVARLVC